MVDKCVIYLQALHSSRFFSEAKNNCKEKTTTDSTDEMDESDHTGSLPIRVISVIRGKKIFI